MNDEPRKLFIIHRLTEYQYYPRQEEVRCKNQYIRQDNGLRSRTTNANRPSVSSEARSAAYNGYDQTEDGGFDQPADDVVVSERVFRRADIDRACDVHQRACDKPSADCSDHVGCD